MWAGPQGLAAAPQERPPPAAGQGAAASLGAALRREGAASHLSLAGKTERFSFQIQFHRAGDGEELGGSSRLAAPFGRGARPAPLPHGGCWSPAQGHFQLLTRAPGLAPHLCAGYPG